MAEASYSQIAFVNFDTENEEIKNEINLIKNFANEEINNLIVTKQENINNEEHEYIKNLEKEDLYKIHILNKFVSRQK